MRHDIVPTYLGAARPCGDGAEWRGRLGQHLGHGLARRAHRRGAALRGARGRSAGVGLPCRDRQEPALRRARLAGEARMPRAACSSWATKEAAVPLPLCEVASTARSVPSA